jgi:hypothetical protein
MRLPSHRGAVRDRRSPGTLAGAGLEVTPVGNAERKAVADRFLYEMGLLDELRKYGEPHIVGSYTMDVMAWDDLDIDVENDSMSMARLYELTAFVTARFSPVWYEAKQETDDRGRAVWFHGFETTVLGERWNIDLWFFDAATIAEAEQYCRAIADRIDGSRHLKGAIMQIKEDLIREGVYGSEGHTSRDVYRAVLDVGVCNTEEFLLEYVSGAWQR